MTFNPTKKTQQKWIDKYLNKGICPEDYITCWGETNNNTACYEALNWLSGTRIKTLTEVWERCNNVSWLGWMYARMEPNKKDLRLWWSALNDIFIKIIAKEDSIRIREEINSLEKRVKRMLKNPRTTSRTIKHCIEDCADDIYNEGVDYEYSEKRLANFVRKRIPNPWCQRR